jgi:hypothetical protein
MDIIDEAIDEASGASSKRWALLLLVLVMGGVIALWLSKRARSIESELAIDAAGAPTTEPAAD